jgi:hypothetical protein
MQDVDGRHRAGHDDAGGSLPTIVSARSSAGVALLDQSHGVEGILGEGLRIFVRGRE